MQKTIFCSVGRQHWTAEDDGRTLRMSLQRDQDDWNSLPRTTDQRVD